MHGVTVGLKINDLLNLFKNKKQRLLNFSPKLYLGEGIKPSKLGKIKRKLRREPVFANVTLLVLAENRSDQLDIISSKYLIQSYYGDHMLNVAGIAKDHDDAIALLLRITQECLRSRNDCSLKEFLLWQ